MAKKHRSSYRHSKLEKAFARADREAALRKQNYRCAYCLSKLTVRTVTRDHVKPRSAGGLDHRNNIVAACESCNQLKRSTPYKKFMRLITKPQPGEPMQYRLVWFSRQIELRLDLMESRVMRAVGRKKWH